MRRSRQINIRRVNSYLETIKVYFCESIDLEKEYKKKLFNKFEDYTIFYENYIDFVKNFAKDIDDLYNRKLLSDEMKNFVYNSITAYHNEVKTNGEEVSKNWIVEEKEDK